MNRLTKLFRSPKTKPKHHVDKRHKRSVHSLASATTITSRKDLSLLPSRIVKFREDIVGASSVSKMCPAILSDGSWVILVTPDHVNSDLVSALVKRCEEIASKTPAIYSVTSTYLLSLREGGNAQGSTVRRDSSKTSFMAAFEEILAWGVRNNASDVHLNVEKKGQVSQVCFSIDGKYVAPPRWKIPTERLEEMLQVAWQETQGGGSSVFTGESEHQARIEFSVDNHRYMGRWAGLAADTGPSICIRLLNISETVKMRSLAEQGFLESQIAMFNRAQTSEGGAIVLAGVVGSGKSTTIAELLSKLPRTRKVITLEDPVEFRISNALQNTIVRSLEDNDTDSFLSKLRTVKRSAPHDLLIGEIRDEMTGKAFMDVTGTGTNVYTTVHAKSAFQIPERLASEAIGVPNSFLASPGILNLLVFQALIPVLCSQCAVPIEEFCKSGGDDARGMFRDANYWREYVDRIKRLYGISPDVLRMKSPNGCDACRHTEIAELNGYAGRTVVAEMIEPNADREVLRCILSGETLRLQEHLEHVSRTAITDPDMTNKSILECALYKASLGMFDPRDIEQRTRSFETDELIRIQRQRRGV